MGGGIGMGNTCKPMAVLFQCMTKFTTKKKKKKKHFKNTTIPLMHFAFKMNFFPFRIVTDLHKNHEDNTENSHLPPQPVSPIIIMLVWYIYQY